MPSELMVMSLAQSHLAIFFWKEEHRVWIFVIIQPVPDNFVSVLAKFGCQILELI